jgi:hypothetical protein
LGEVRGALAVPIAAVVSDGQHSTREAVAQALPGVPTSCASSTTARGGQADLRGRP